jgi:hypothetical protein
LKNLLDQPLQAEIKNDEFYLNIRLIASHRHVKNILEIGSGSGRGSTQAFVEGIESNPNKAECRLFCLELSQIRCDQVRALYRYKPFVKCYNYCSIPTSQYMTDDEVREVYTKVTTLTNQYPLEQVLGWLDGERDYIKERGIPDDGIPVIMQENNIEQFDAVLIDGSIFTARAELRQVYGAEYIMLDDTNDIKNYQNHALLMENQGYSRFKANITLRNGYAIFKRRSDRILPPFLF